ncbi:zinc finger autosomal protein isoform X2 [Hyalella azteca]|uniref:Zinc finger autosomal protein isoform X2 n=1 Tax=Hyalella azteca TaxID=294128 RepID=A0A979FJR3_HYAAZ|nr:zinc finger autosomal protein isoform X2 [Hyalella azteca]
MIPSAQIMRKCSVVLHKLSDGEGLSGADVWTVRRGWCPEQSLTHVSTGGSKLKSEGEPESEEDEITVKEEPICIDENEPTPPPPPCVPCKKEADVTAHKAQQDGLQDMAVQLEEQDGMLCKVHVNAGQEAPKTAFHGKMDGEMSDIKGVISSDSEVKLHPTPERGTYKHLVKRQVFAKHGLGKRFQCKICDYVASQKLHLKCHMISKHKIGPGRQCKICDYVGAMEIHLKKHLFSKHGIGTGIQCKMCDYSTTQKQFLKSHMFSKHRIGDGFQCKMCDFVTAHKYRLKSHLFSKHGIGTWFPCKMCDHVAHQKEHLKAHIILTHRIGTGFQ